MSDGDTVIIYLSISSVYALSVKSGKVFQTKYGALKHDDVIGTRYGDVLNCSRGWAYVLQPTPELWTLTLPHRTQILYAPDISVITLQLELKPGSVVCEAGTGSGSLSHAILRTIAPNGHLFTFDFHEQRVEKAKEEFDEHGLSELVTLGHRDVVSTGFGLDGVADAVFLDLPLPWNVVPSAVTALKPSGGRICSFSPCIEQVQKTCTALAANGFIDIATMECLQRTYEVKTVDMPVIEVPPVQQHQVLDEVPQVQGSSHEEANPAAGSHRRFRLRPMSSGPHHTFATALPPLQMTGHTGYLTFATLLSR